MTDCVYEIACSGDDASREALQGWFDGTATPAWASLPGLRGLDVYTAFSGNARDPFCDDGLGPLLIAMLQFPTPETMTAALADARFSQGLGGLPPDIAVTGTPMQRQFFPVPGDEHPTAIRSPFSYVVRYRRPADDEAAFVANYVGTHPQMLMRLPRVRSILCYVPMAASSVLPAADTMLGNEVTFDNLDDFNAAMASPERKEARADFHTFPRFTGRNTHYPMMRRPVYATAR